MKMTGLLVVATTALFLTPLLVGAGDAPWATPVAPGYITDVQVAAAMVKGGVLLQNPGLTIAAERSTVPSDAVMDQTTHHIFYIHDGAATLVIGGRLTGKVIRRTASGQQQATCDHSGQDTVLVEGSSLRDWLLRRP